MEADISAVANHSQLIPIVQTYLDRGVKVKELSPMITREHEINISTRTLQRLISKHHLRTVRNPQLDLDAAGIAILQLTQEDPLGAWGARKVQEKLRLRGIHLSRTFIEDFQRVRAPEDVEMRKASSKKIARRGLISPGPNEEWCVDGHKKLREQMGIDVRGICDKYSRRELGLWAVPNARMAIVPPALFLMLVKEKKGLIVMYFLCMYATNITYLGIPLQVTSDMGSETGQLAALQTALRRTEYLPGLTVDELAPHRFVKSMHNITRERAWRPIFHQELKNILATWQDGQMEVGYRDSDPTHHMFAVWLWAQVVQDRLNHLRDENAVHKVHKQARVILPTGGRIEDFYNNPEKWGGKEMLVPVDEEVIERLLLEHTPQRLFQFGTDEGNRLAQALFEQLGCPKVDVRNAWATWRNMIDLLAEITANTG
ncbi:hypothetical protein JB92DRAFT_3262896 [Gautieria morchelliformis]|nr:hypothetical protein JB92DRAFT_3262896 [Gautieria morchelliformis]